MRRGRDQGVASERGHKLERYCRWWANNPHLRKCQNGDFELRYLIYNLSTTQKLEGSTQRRIITMTGIPNPIAKSISILLRSYSIQSMTHKKNCLEKYFTSDLVLVIPLIPIA